MLKQHTYYVYYKGNKIFARMEDKEPVLAEELDTAQEASKKVQSIINPDGLSAFDIDGNVKGFLHESFQEKISPNCEEYVKKAYNV